MTAGNKKKGAQMVTGKLLLLFLAGAALTLCGCASSIKTFDAEGKPSPGIPIVTPLVVQIEEETTYEVDPENTQYAHYCMPETNVTYQVLPFGERSYITLEPSSFGKGEFRVEFTDNGLLKGVSLNSDASAGAEKVTELIKTVLPYLTAPKPAVALRAPEKTAQAKKEQYCIKKGTQVKSVRRLRLE